MKETKAALLPIDKNLGRFTLNDLRATTFGPFGLVAIWCKNAVGRDGQTVRRRKNFNFCNLIFRCRSLQICYSSVFNTLNHQDLETHSNWSNCALKLCTNFGRRRWRSMRKLWWQKIRKMYPFCESVLLVESWCDEQYPMANKII